MADQKEYKEVDKNMIVETKLKEQDIKFYDVRTAPVDIYGLYDPRGEASFKRLPDEIGMNINEGVKELYLHPAGGRIRFSTDSAYIAIKCEMPYINRYSHMPMTGTTGFDLFIDDEIGSQMFRTFKPDPKIEDGYESVLYPWGSGMRHYTIDFPTYNAVDKLYIGIQEGATLTEGLKYRSDKPIVYYGSSITQGGCSTHPGAAYEAVISRHMNLDHLNFGFSGSGRGEESIARYMASLPMIAFVSDYDHNAPNAEHLANTHRRLYDIIRESHPDIPYIMISLPNFYANTSESIKRRNVIIESYRYAREKGDKNLYFIDGEGFFRGPEYDFCLVDSAHPTDAGFAKMAEGIERVLVRALRYAKI